MKIKKYIVESMKDAIAKIREELGPDAVILHSRKASVAGNDGKKHHMFEVTAAIEELSKEDAGQSTGLEMQPKQSGPSKSHSILPKHSDDSDGQDSIDFLIDDDTKETEPKYTIAGAGNKKMLGRTRNPDAIPKTSIRLSELHQSMLENDLDEMIAESLIKTAMEETRIAGDRDVINESLPKSLDNFITCSGPIDFSGTKPKVIALVGPTGVGKTTTIAKLATTLAIDECKKVSLVTVDIQRAASVQQLKSYAEMLKTPFETVLNPAELRRAVKIHSDKDIVLIDTAGRSPYKWISILELATFFKGIDNAEIHLVLSAATSTKENLAAVERFGVLQISELIFTKIDEIRDHGAIVNIASACKKPISFLTTGQNIPDDIEIASCERIFELVSKPKGKKR